MIQQINSINFKGVYQNPKPVYSKDQENVINDIVQKLQGKDENGESVEDKYKDKHFYMDFARNDAIILRLFHGMQRLDSRNVRVKKADVIGVYDKNHEFQPDDVEKSLNDKKGSNYLYKMFSGLAIGFALCLLGANLANKCSKLDAKQLDKFMKAPQDTLKKVHASTFKPAFGVH